MSHSSGMATGRGVLLLLSLLGCIFFTPSEGRTKCSFTPVNNQSFVDKVHQYFDEDSDVRIVEYVISFNVTPPFDWSKYSRRESFQPWRWFRTQGSGSSRLLLAFYYYYGLFKDYLIETTEVSVTLNLEPQGCEENFENGEFDVLLQNYLLRDFDINPKTVRHPYTVSDDVGICSMYLDDVDGWGRLTYRCCHYDDDDNDDNGKRSCDDIYNDGWVWALRSLVIMFTILLFLYLPSFIPGRHRVNTYEYFPPEDTCFDLVVTSHPDHFKNVRNATIIKSQEWRRMEAFRTEVDKLQKETVYNAHVKRAACQVSLDHIARKNHAPVSFSRSFFDSFVLCKIRHKRPVEECCHTSICGELCCGGTCCPPWHAWLRGFRVIMLMGIMAIPALPLFYVMTADDLEYQELDKAQRDRGLHRTFNIYPGKILGRIAVGILASMYVLNTLILVLDGATDGILTKLYSSVLDIAQKKSTVRFKMMKTKGVVKKAMRPLQKYGIYILPIWLIGVALLPVILVILFIINSPMAKILTHATKKILRRLNVISRTDIEANERFVSFCKTFWFLVSLVFVFIVFTLGINLIVHVVAIVIVEIVVDSSVVYQVLPVVMFLLFYIRDAFHKVGETYKTYLNTVLESLITKNHDELIHETRKSWPLEKNLMFDIDKEQCEQNPQDTTTIAGQKERISPMFEERHGGLRIRLKRVVVFLSKNEVLSTSKKFLFETCDMECFGVPGRLDESFIVACINFLKIATFLLFVFIAVMAYGSIYSISPTNHLFITLVTGLIPLVVQNLFQNKDEDRADNSSFRYEGQLNQKIQSFVQSWELKDLFIDSINQRSNSEIANEQIGSGLTSSRMANYRQPSTKTMISTLILDVSDEEPIMATNSTKKSKHPEKSKRPAPKEKSTRVGSSSGCCGGEKSDANDYVDDNNKPQRVHKLDRGDHRTENKVDTNTGIWKEDETAMHNEMSNVGKWKGKKKTLPGLESPSRAETRELDLQKLVQQPEQEGAKNVPERQKVKRQKSSNDFRRITSPPASWQGGDQGHSNSSDQNV